MDVCEDIEVSPGAKEFDLLLISMYRDSPELWDTKAQAYTDKNKRSIALNKITNELKKYDTEFTVEKLKRKINTLRSNFNREHTKVKRSLMSGVMDEVYRPKLWYYNEFEFITDARDTKDTECSMQRISVSEIEHNSPIASSANKIIKKRKTYQNEESLANNFLKTSDEEIDIIAKSWAIKLKRLNPLQRRFAEKIINDVLFEGEMETLTRDGVIFVPAPANQAMSQATCMSSSSMQYLNSQSPGESYAQIQSPDSHDPEKSRCTSSPCSLPEEPSASNSTPSDTYAQIHPDNSGSDGSCTSSILTCHAACTSRDRSKIKRHHCCSSEKCIAKKNVVTNREMYLPLNVKKEQE
ncbi:uncharacterized protein LOC123699725 [Colias croceus]|uniref:uncharacterized protein LOC123699725 n=1 Tax=Colias crocea TaxID=72248 RepID=UPI001E27D00D|nr:uncharacterized protein LOC123699725 [Colias croceus]